MEEAKLTRWKTNQANKAVSTRLTTDHNKSDAKPYLAGRAFTTCIVLTDKEQLEVWYLDSCALKYICNN